MKYLFFLMIWLVGCAAPRVIDKPIKRGPTTNQHLLTDHVNCGVKSGIKVPVKDYPTYLPTSTISGVVYSMCMEQKGWR